MKRGKCSERVHALGAKRLKCMGGRGFNGRAADLSILTVVLLLRASASALPPLGPSLLSLSLCTQQRKDELGRVQRARVPLAREPTLVP